MSPPRREPSWARGTTRSPTTRWPTPHPMTLWLDTAGSSLTLPVVPLDAPTVPTFDAPAPQTHPAQAGREGDIQPTPWAVDRVDGAAMASWRAEESLRFPWGRMRSIESLRFRVSDDRPAGAAAL